MASGRLTLQQLNNPEAYRGVSMRTRTDIIGAIGIDIEGLTVKEGGKYTEKELIEGLRYLLTKNKKISHYMETSPTYSNYNDPFYVPNGTDWLLLSVMLNSSMPHHHHHSGSLVSGDLCGGSSPSNEDEAKGLLACLIVAVACCICIGAAYNTSQVVNNGETTTTQVLKVIGNGASFLIPAAGSFYLFMNVFDKNDPYYYAYVSGLSFLIGALSALLVSSLNRIKCTDAQAAQLKHAPSAELLAELKTIEGFLEGQYNKPGDDPVECKRFIKDVVNYYIQQIAKANTLEATEKTPLVKKDSPRLFRVTQQIKPQNIQDEDELKLAKSFS